MTIRAIPVSRLRYAVMSSGKSLTRLMFPVLFSEDARAIQPYYTPAPNAAQAGSSWFVHNNLLA